MFAVSFGSEGFAAGAMAIGKCGAFGYAYDYARAASAEDAAKAKCKGNCPTTVAMNRACAAFSVDMSNPCGAHGYAVQPRISKALNTASEQCYKNGGKDCVIRAWACDAKG
jgi:hypothetical protein